MAKDILGRDIVVGHLVVVPHTGANKLIVGRVLSISAKQCRIRCLQGHQMPGKNFRDGDVTVVPEITQRNHEHCCIVENADD